jgi:enoyl-CoA hydratase/carnithine racemase
VAELRGTTAGFGLDLALICDMRVAESGAAFTSAFARLGLVPDGGSTYTLPRLVGVGQALRFLIAGETLTAPRAFELGLVDEVRAEAELEPAVTAIGRAIAASASSSVRAIKRMVRGDELGGLEQALSAEGAAQIQALQGPEFQRRLEAFVSR